MKTLKTKLGKKLIYLGARLLRRGHIVVTNGSVIIPTEVTEVAIIGAGGGGPRYTGKSVLIKVPSADAPWADGGGGNEAD